MSAKSLAEGGDEFELHLVIRRMVLPPSIGVGLEPTHSRFNGGCGDQQPRPRSPDRTGRSQ